MARHCDCKTQAEHDDWGKPNSGKRILWLAKHDCLLVGGECLQPAWAVQQLELVDQADDDEPEIVWQGVEPPTYDDVRAERQLEPWRSGPGWPGD